MDIYSLIVQTGMVDQTWALLFQWKSGIACATNLANCRDMWAMSLVLVIPTMWSMRKHLMAMGPGLAPTPTGGNLVELAV